MRICPRLGREVTLFECLDERASSDWPEDDELCAVCRLHEAELADPPRVAAVRPCEANEQPTPRAWPRKQPEAGKPDAITPRALDPLARDTPDGAEAPVSPQRPPTRRARTEDVAMALARVLRDCRLDQAFMLGVPFPELAERVAERLRQQGLEPPLARVLSRIVRARVSFPKRRVPEAQGRSRRMVTWTLRTQRFIGMRETNV